MSRSWIAIIAVGLAIALGITLFSPWASGFSEPTNTNLPSIWFASHPSMMACRLVPPPEISAPMRISLSMMESIPGGPLGCQ